MLTPTHYALRRNGDHAFRESRKFVLKQIVIRYFESCPYGIRRKMLSIEYGTVPPRANVPKHSIPCATIRAGWRIDDLLVVSKQFGIECRSSGGSHYVFSFRNVANDVTVPARRPIKPVYIRQFL